MTPLLTNSGNEIATFMQRFPIENPDYVLDCDHMIEANPNLDHWAKIIDDLLTFRNFEADWDGFGAEAPGKEIVDSALRLVERLQNANAAPANRVVASPDGKIVLEWQTADTHCEIEVVNPGYATTFQKSGDQPAIHDSLTWQLS